MPSLRTKLIRLAHSQPDLRPHLLPLLRQAAPDFHAIRKEVLDSIQKVLSTRIMRSALDLRLYRAWSGEIEYNLDKIDVEEQGGQYKVVLTGGPLRRMSRPEVLAKGTDPRKLGNAAAKVYLRKYMNPDIEKITEHKEQKAREEAARYEREKATREEARRKQEQQSQAEEQGVWSVAQTGYQVGGDAEEEFQGYVAEVETFTSKDEAIAYAKSIGGATVVRGTQMWNEPVGQVEEHDRTAWTRFYR